ncbi:glycosyltransferase [Jatrophihabitans sp.]|uniref:glycosyltransferase n=1 Tax=Jatrophihabitans sp. TaxID=1932789 RepID=UPI002CB97855|nr:glycosyltransferase [Jatrophihabitans sp.]
MARFLIVVFPLASHLYAPVAIGQALAGAGHEVAWCGPETDLRPLVGDRARIYPTGKRYYRDYPDLGVAGARKLWTDVVIPATRFLLAPVDEAVADYRPDVLVSDQYTLAGALVACRRDLRWATLATGAMELTPPSWELPGHPEFVAGQLARAWQLAGLPGRPPVDLRFSPHLVLALTSTALTGAAPLPPQCVCIGPVLGRRPAEPVGWPAREPGRHQVLVTVGTLAAQHSDEFYRRMLPALELLADRVQAVVLAPAEAIPDPPGNITVLDRVPILDVLPRLDAVVCHGGMGTVTESLAHGVPLVVAPIRADQPAIARQVAQAGAGIEVSFFSASPAELATALTAVLEEPGYRAAARRVAEDFAAAGGAAAAVEQLAALAAGPDAGPLGCPQSENPSVL